MTDDPYLTYTLTALLTAINVKFAFSFFLDSGIQGVEGARNLYRGNYEEVVSVADRTNPKIALVSKIAAVTFAAFSFATPVSFVDEYYEGKPREVIRAGEIAAITVLCASVLLRATEQLLNKRMRMHGAAEEREVANLIHNMSAFIKKLKHSSIKEFAETMNLLDHESYCRLTEDLECSKERLCEYLDEQAV